MHNGHCEFSPCRKWRYTLWRRWREETEKGYLMICALNPSTADELILDPTVNRCVNYAKEWGYDALCMTNIFAYRATDPKVMKAQEDPVGLDNDYWLQKMAKGAGLIIAAWGTHGEFMGRGEQVKNIIPNLHCLKITKNGYPSHPLYLKKDIVPIPY